MVCHLEVKDAVLLVAEDLRLPVQAPLDVGQPRRKVLPAPPSTTLQPVLLPPTLYRPLPRLLCGLGLGGGGGCAIPGQ